VAEEVVDGEIRIRLSARRRGRLFDLHVTTADGATATGAFQPPREADLRWVRMIVDPRRAPARGVDSEEIDVAREFGALLFDQLTAHDEIRSVYRSARRAAERANRPMRITLSLTDAPGLASIPWELLYESPKFLAQSSRTPIVRYLEVDTESRPLPVDFPLHVLGMVSRPDGFDPIDAEAEKANLERALADLEADGRVRLRWLDGRLEDLVDEVHSERGLHVFHYIGHGDFDAAEREGCLVLEREDRRPERVGGRRLGQFLSDRGSLRLAVLNACDGAKSSFEDPFSGVASGLIQHGIPAVIGMQYPISDEAAIAFATTLYTQLAAGHPVDTAVARARQKLASKATLEWATPVLFMRLADGRIFDIALTDELPAAPPPPPPTSEEPAGDWRLIADTTIRVTDLIRDEKWETALAELAPALAEAPGDGQLAALHDAARRGRDRDRRYANARRLVDEGRWPEAVKELSALSRAEAGYRDVADLLARARDEQVKARRRRRLEARLDEGRAMLAAEDWDGALGVARAGLRADPGEPDLVALRDAAIEGAATARAADQSIARAVSAIRTLLAAERWEEALAAADEALAASPRQEDLLALRTAAREGAARAKKAGDLERRYASATANIEAGRLARAEATLASLTRTDPGYRDVDTLLERVRRGQDEKRKVERALVEGRAKLAGGDAAGALVSAREGLRIAPDHRGLAELRRKADRAQAQERREAKAAAAKAAALAGHVSRARDHVDGGRWKPAMAEIAAGLKLDAGNAELRTLEGVVTQALRRPASSPAASPAPDRPPAPPRRPAEPRTVGDGPATRTRQAPATAGGSGTTFPRTVGGSGATPRATARGTDSPEPLVKWSPEFRKFLERARTSLGHPPLEKWASEHPDRAPGWTARAARARKKLESELRPLEGVHYAASVIFEPLGSDAQDALVAVTPSRLIIVEERLWRTRVSSEPLETLVATIKDEQIDCSRPLTLMPSLVVPTFSLSRVAGGAGRLHAALGVAIEKARKA
jgi:hypothetical protein